MCRPLLLLVLGALLIAVSSVPSTCLLAESIPRHTPGFPEVTNMSLAELFKVLNISQVEPEEMPEESALSWDINSIQDAELRTSLNQTISQWLLEGATEEDIRSYIEMIDAMYRSGEISETDYIKALSAIKNVVDVVLYKQLAETVSELDDEDLRSYIGLLIDMYEQGYITLDNLAKALEDIASSSDISESDYNKIASMVDTINSMEPLLHETTTLYTDVLNEVAKELGSLQQFIPQEQLGGLSLPKPPELRLAGGEGGISIGMPSLVLPSLALPQIYMENTQNMIYAFLVLLGLILIAFVFKYLSRKGLTSRLAMLISSRFRPLHVPAGSLEGFPKVVRIYWSAVGSIERKLGVPKLDHETHREFLLKAGKALGERVKAFEKITHAYELYRFAGVSSREVEAMAEEGLRELVGGGEVG